MKFELNDGHSRASKPSAIPAPATPKNLEEVAFASVRELAELVRTKKVSSVALTEMYLERLRRHDTDAEICRRR